MFVAAFRLLTDANGMARSIRKVRMGAEAQTHFESLGAGFRCFPSVPVKELPKRLSRSGLRSSTLLLPLLRRLTGTISSLGVADPGGELTGVPPEWLLAVSLSSFSDLSLTDPASERPNKWRFFFGSFALTLSVCAWSRVRPVYAICSRKTHLAHDSPFILDGV